MIRVFFVFSLLFLLSSCEKKSVISDRDNLKKYISTLSINWNGDYISDTQLNESYGSDKYEINVLDTLHLMDCVIYEVKSAMIRFIVLYDVSNNKYSHIFTFPHFLADSEMYTDNRFFYSDDDENFRGLEYYFSITSKPDSLIVSCELRKLLSIYNSDLFSEQRLVSSHTELVDILNTNNIFLSKKDKDLFSYIFVDQMLFVSPRKKPLFFNVYYYGSGIFYVVGIFKETPTTLINEKIKIWVHVVYGEKM